MNKNFTSKFQSAVKTINFFQIFSILGKHCNKIYPLKMNAIQKFDKICPMTKKHKMLSKCLMHHLIFCRFPEKE